MSKKQFHPAFPTTPFYNPETKLLEFPSRGINQREYFAGLAMQGLLAGGMYNDSFIQEIAAYAVESADALVEALNKQ